MFDTIITSLRYMSIIISIFFKFLCKLFLIGILLLMYFIGNLLLSLAGLLEMLKISLQVLCVMFLQRSIPVILSGLYKKERVCPLFCTNFHRLPLKQGHLPSICNALCGNQGNKIVATVPPYPTPDRTRRHSPLNIGPTASKKF